ncbi:hypothetical protein Smar_1464 [Staphylothermus marinus F1]|uniref:Uncharacterized protein n=1 Tax=Staphylothermus marinus (strain ATCC 43588 / DSM 3639 / JCM 9404 / F1) TaxID=399550 RepID=A3DPJ3_STAMF|nr:hypothetical protein [Staphylothermus marinus]ABN70553.1 hypothetical protein Smar_1464 [Staphylothermus marinus F1]
MHEALIASILIILMLPLTIASLTGSTTVLIRANGTFSMSSEIIYRINSTMNSKLEGSFINGEMISINISQSTMQKENINVSFEMFRKNTIFYGNLTENYRGADKSFYNRETFYTIKLINNNKMNISYLTINVTSNNKKIILHWNITLLSIALLTHNESITTRYKYSNNLYKLKITIRNGIVNLNNEAKKLFTQILFTRYNYTLIWNILPRVNKIKTIINTVDKRMNMQLYYSINGLDLPTNKSKYVLPIIIQIRNNTLSIINIPIGLINYVLFTRASWNSTCINGLIRSNIYAEGIGLKTQGFDKIHSIIYSATRSIGSISNTTIVGSNIYFNINGNITNKFILTPKMNISTINIVYNTNTGKTTSAREGEQVTWLIIIGSVITIMIILYVLYRYRVFSRRA